MQIDKVQELIGLALQLNSTNGSTEVREDNGIPTVYINFNGNINCLDITVYENGFLTDKKKLKRIDNGKKDKSFSIYLDDNGVLTELGLERYEECKAYLTDLLEATNES